MLEIQRNENVKVGDRDYKFTHRAAGGNLCFRDPADGNVLELTEEDILAKFFAGDVKLNLPEPVDGDQKVRSLDFSSLPEEWRKVAEDRVKVLKAIYACESPRPMAKKWPPIIERVARFHRMEDIPEWTTVRRWMRKYEGNNGDLRCLIPGYGRRGRKQAPRTNEETEFLLQAIKELYLIKARPTIKSLHDQVETRYRQIQKVRVDACLWKVPSASTLHRMLKRIDGYEHDRARFGKRIADQKYATIGRGEVATRRLQVVEIDHTVANVQILDDLHKVRLGRPTITIAIDRFTRMIVGLYIGFEPPSTYSIMQCLRNMILPKAYMQTEYPSIKFQWKAYGVPESVVVDNAFEFTSDQFRSVAAALRFDIRQQPVRQPEFKGMVERFMLTIEQSAMSGLPGRTFGSVKEKGDYDSMKEACLTLKEFRQHFHHWVLAKYCYVTHSGIVDVPARRWDEDVKQHPVRLPMSVEDLDVCLGITKSGTLRRDGIRFANLHFNSRELSDLRRELGGNAKVRFKVNPSDLTEINVIHPTKHYPIRAFCTFPEYALGINLHQHRMIRALMLKSARNFERQADFLAARDIFQQEAAELLARGTSRRRERAARSKGGENVQQPSNDNARELVRKLTMSPESDTDLETFLEQDTSFDQDGDISVVSETTTAGPSSGLSRSTSPDDDDLAPLPSRDRSDDA